MTNFDYSQVSKLLDSLPTGLWLEGKNVAATGGATFEVLDPATEEVIANVADGTSADWMRALELADAAQRSGRVLRRVPAPSSSPTSSMQSTSARMTSLA